MAVSIRERGAKIFIMSTRGPAQDLRSRTAYFLPRLLGSISPAKNTMRVVMMVLTDTAESPHALVTATVTREAMAICTILVHIRRVLIARSKLSIKKSAFFALSSPCSAASFILLREAEARAVSATAKYMVTKSSAKATNKGNRLPSSILGYSSPSVKLHSSITYPCISVNIPPF